MNLELLSRIYGHVGGLHWLPMMRSLRFEGSCRQAAWETAYHRRGLAFGTDRQTTEALRALTAEGMLSTGGATLGKTWRLTEKGVFTALAAQDLPSETCRDLLARIIKLQAVSAVPNPYGDKAPLVMAWDLIPSAGDWLQAANKTAKTVETYTVQLSQLSNWMEPLLMLGLVSMQHNSTGWVWGVTVKDEGRAAVATWPEAPTVEADGDACFRAWVEGFDAALAKYTTANPPKEYQNIVPCLLPQSKWY